ncbi:hypothetical protein halTADL_1841 [Halohasta litchfieldiae]|uniref:RecA-superfamily ATPase, KaiC/GvpD/RAD55 family n=1 Tax=Halohasta litchfieldiae TaxID=1073996 RepID=A0A1H6R196_9EURY|nr:hypothetical protein [Halohasta litchfieldiae]ATW88594.1 hypothetical protein halTADL_1841 [Halohasta litchfieldiae]SEI48166.1 hypothetical protein SAMN05444271_101124 [Halohasta litchfieldiae]
MSVEELPLASTLTEAESVVIAGPPMSGKYNLMHRILGEAGDRSIILSTGHDAERVRADYAETTGHDPKTSPIVDCVTREQGAEVEDTDLTKYASSPKNLTELGVKFTELAENWESHTDTSVGVHSLSQLLMYWDADRIYQFVRVLLGRTRNQGWLTVAVINSTMHDERTLHTLLDPFDTVVDTRTTDEGWEMRLRDRNSSPTAWQEF